MNTFEPTHEIVPDLVEDGLWRLVSIKQEQQEDEYPPRDGPGTTFGPLLFEEGEQHR